MSSDEPTLILLPVFNDWEVLALLLPRLGAELSRAGGSFGVLVIDDGSTEPMPEGLLSQPTGALPVRVIRLRRNLGHQRAIAIGLTFAFCETKAPRVVVMDSDGEDAPADVPRLLERCRAESDTKIIFAERTRRSESLLFRVFYLLFKAVHLLLTGQRVRVGNFSVVPRSALEGLVGAPELWSHYAAAAFKIRLPRELVPTVRATRLGGRSKMNFVGLVVHGLSAISVYGELIGVRVLTALGVLIVALIAGIGAVLGVRLGSGQGVPGWAMVTLGIMLITLTQAVMLAVLFVFSILGARQSATFLPIRDYRHYIAGVK